MASGHCEGCHLYSAYLELNQESGDMLCASCDGRALMKERRPRTPSQQMELGHRIHERPGEYLDRRVLNAAEDVRNLVDDKNDGCVIVDKTSELVHAVDARRAGLPQGVLVTDSLEATRIEAHPLETREDKPGWYTLKIPTPVEASITLCTWERDENGELWSVVKVKKPGETELRTVSRVRASELRF